MGQTEKLTGAWVEIQERGAKDQLVLMRADANVPSSRGGRRQLELDPEGCVLSMAQGATDRLEAQAEGDWSMIDENTLELKLEGWEGEYTVESMTDTELILNRR